MLVLGKINIPEKIDLKLMRKYLKTFSMYYIKTVYKSRDLTNQTKVKRLNLIQNYIQNTYKTNKTLYDMIQNILYAINITKEGIIYTSKEHINTIKVDQIFKLVTFGNLNLQKSAIFNEALRYGIKATKVMMSYGR